MQPDTLRATGAKRLPALDLMRFVAACAVMAYHFGFHGGVTGKYLDDYSEAIGHYTRYGYLGVDVFFVISGFVIAWSAQGSTSGRFVWNRWLRVYPTYIFAMLVTSLVVVVAGDHHFTVSARQVAAHLLVDPRRLGFDLIDGVYWTIICELQFYAMVAIGLGWPMLRRHADACLAAWLCAAALNEMLLQRPALSYLLLSPFAGLFVLGIVIYRLHDKRGNTITWLLGAAASALAIWTTYKVDVKRFADNGQPWSPLLVTGLLALSIIVVALSLRLRFRADIERRLQQIGALTYPLYLLHATLGFIAINRLAPHIGLGWAITAAIIGSIVLAAGVANIVEPRLKKLATRLRDRLASGLGRGWRAAFTSARPVGTDSR